MLACFRLHMRRQLTACALAPLCSFTSLASAAEPGPDRFDYSVRSETHVRLFERALMPGPAGALVRSQRLAPIHEYVTGYVVDLDAPWGADGLDAEFGAWQSLWLGQIEYESRFDADVSVASVTARYQPVYVRLGRQVVAGGAARYTRLDGLAAGVGLAPGVQLAGYGGLTVLPRWSDRPGYHFLGSATESLVRDPAMLPEPERTGYWATGARASYELEQWVEAGVSFHEERHAGELGRRNLGLDVYAAPIKPVTAGLNGLLDTDQAALADLKVWARYDHDDLARFTGRYVRTDPEFFLSRQSVLSVFGTDNFDEAGLEVSVDPTSRLELGGAAYLQIWSRDELGTRLSLRARGTPDPDERLTLQGVYARVSAIDNGYHSLRASIRYRFMARAAAVAEQYTYLYDEPIHGHDMSLVEALSVSYDPIDPLSLLLGGSLAQTPYARMDAQLQATATLTFDGAGGRR